jgi:hypothetical protein
VVLPAQVVAAHVGPHPPSQAAVKQFNFPPEVRNCITTVPLRELARCRAEGAQPAASASVPPQQPNGASSGQGAVAAAPANEATRPEQRLGSAPAPESVGQRVPEANVGSREDAAERTAASSMEAGAAAALEETPQGAAPAETPDAAEGAAITAEAGAEAVQEDSKAAAAAAAAPLDGAAPMDMSGPQAANGAASNGTAAVTPPHQNGGPLPAPQAAGARQAGAGTSGRVLPQPVQQARICAALLCAVYFLGH